MMKQSGIQFLQMVGSSDLNTPLADPEYIGLLSSSSSLEVLVHAYKIDHTGSNYPVLLEN